MSNESAEQRIVNLEMALAHLQHDLEQMSSVVLDQQRKIETLQVLLKQMEHQLADENEPAEKRSPLDERPPHY